MPIQAKCPICRKLATHGETSFPFCSTRCQEIDLGKWAEEEYRIPGPTLEDFPGRVEEDPDDEARNR